MANMRRWFVVNVAVMLAAATGTVSSDRLAAEEAECPFHHVR